MPRSNLTLISSLAIRFSRVWRW